MNLLFYLYNCIIQLTLTRSGAFTAHQKNTYKQQSHTKGKRFCFSVRLTGKETQHHKGRNSAKDGFSMIQVASTTTEPYSPKQVGVGIRQYQSIFIMSKL